MVAYKIMRRIYMLLLFGKNLAQRQRLYIVSGQT